jgi:RNA exonuclease 4|tara:strand:+ start:593 stop:1045 length:453 start_codon:yes stop_codon:yes gene_type:complete
MKTAMVLVRRSLPSRTAILVGQNVSKDIEWLGLREGEDFKGVVDLCGVWRTWNPKFSTYSVFSQDHLVRRLLQGQLELNEKHCAEGDSVKSMKLFQLWRELHHAPEKLQREKEKLLEGTPEPSFAKRFPTFEGVCMGNRKTCTCGAPFFG